MPNNNTRMKKLFHLLFRNAIFYILSFSQVEPQLFPYGGCSVRSCASTPIAAQGPFATGQDAFCWTMYTRPCFEQSATTTCCATFGKMFQKIVLQTVPSCQHEIANVTLNGQKKGGGVYFETHGGESAELKITNLLVTNLTLANGMQMCINFVPNSTCSDPDMFFGSSAHMYSIYDPFSNVCCPTCSMNSLWTPDAPSDPFTSPPPSHPNGSPPSTPPPQRPQFHLPPPRQSPRIPQLPPRQSPRIPQLPPRQSPSIPQIPPRIPPEVIKLLPPQSPPPLQPFLCDNQLQFGKTCSVPLGKNCPWSTPSNVPIFFTIGFSYNSSTSFYDFRVSQTVPSVVIQNWIQNSSHPTTTTINQINQLILPFPQESLAELASEINNDAFNIFIEKVISRPGSVTSVPNSIYQPLAVGHRDLVISTRMGNVYGRTGYYIYVQTMWNDGDSFSIPKMVFDLIPRTADDGLVEYSFYGSEEYCKLQYSG